MAVRRKAKDSEPNMGHRAPKPRKKFRKKLLIEEIPLHQLNEEARKSRVVRTEVEKEEKLDALKEEFNLVDAPKDPDLPKEDDEVKEVTETSKDESTDESKEDPKPSKTTKSKAKTKGSK